MIAPEPRKKRDPERALFCKRARIQAFELKAPPKAIKAYLKQYDNARARNIPFIITFAEWWEWWSQDGRWERRGRKMHDFVMARHNDDGPYASDNIYCATLRENSEIAWSFKNPPRMPPTLPEPVEVAEEECLFKPEGFACRVKGAVIAAGSYRKAAKASGVPPASLHKIASGRDPGTENYFQLVKWLTGNVPWQ